MLFYLFCAVLILLYWLNIRRFNYWAKRNFVQDNDTTVILGSMKPLVFQQRSFGEHFSDIYERFKNKTKIVGVYMFYRPALVVTDTLLVQDILIRDFSYFHDRPSIIDEERDPISAHLFNINGQKWRDLRVKLVSNNQNKKLTLKIYAVYRFHLYCYIFHVYPLFSHQHSQVVN
jgi:cytochrome P450 family 6